MAIAPLQHQELRPDISEVPEDLLRTDSLGLLAILATQDRDAYYTESGSRAAELHAYNHEGYWHGLSITPPAEKFDQLNQLTPVMIHSPGFGERIEESAGKAFHDKLAEEIPNAWMISLAIDGLGDTGQQYGNPLEWFRHTLSQQARRKHSLIHEIAGERPVILLGTSMGSFKNLLLLANRESNDPRTPNVVGAFFISPAIVPKEHRRRMTVEFPLKVARDIVLKALRSTAEEREILMPKRGLGWREAVALVGHGLNMLECTSEEDIEKMLRALPAGAIIGGERDAVAMMEHWPGRVKSHPNFRVVPVPNAGHDFAASPQESAQTVAEEIRLSGVLSS